MAGPGAGLGSLGGRVEFPEFSHGGAALGNRGDVWAEDSGADGCRHLLCHLDNEVWMLHGSVSEQLVG